MSASGTATRPTGRTGFRRLLADANGFALCKEGDGLCWMQPDHPARLRPTDLAEPEEFHRRLTEWCQDQR